MTNYDNFIKSDGRDDAGYPAHPKLITAGWRGGFVGVDDLADRVITAITEAVADGSVPWDVADFSELHNYVDANEFILEVLAIQGLIGAHFCVPTGGAACAFGVSPVKLLSMRSKTHQSLRYARWAGTIANSRGVHFLCPRV